MCMRASNALRRGGGLRRSPRPARAPSPQPHKTKGPPRRAPLTPRSSPDPPKDRTGSVSRECRGRWLERQTEAELHVARALARLELVEVLVRRGRLVHLEAGGRID